MSLTNRFVSQGDCAISGDSAIQFQTVLGSCVSLCARCPQTGIGGMNHFLLPARLDGDEVESDSRRFGVFAVESLLNGVSAQAKTARTKLELKAFGGASVLPSMTNVGRANITFLEGVLQRDSLRLAASDLGGDFGRKVIFHPGTGKAWVKRLAVVDQNQIVAEEAARLIRPQSKGGDDDIELFG